MVTEEKITGVVLARYRLGTVLVWSGVITWVPFIVLRMVGEKPSLFLFLPFHLIGVLSGARLRAIARKELTGVLSGILFLGLSYLINRKAVLQT